MIDFSWTNHGSLYLLTPLSAPAIEWTDKNFLGTVRWGAHAVVVEPRYAADLTAQLEQEGWRFGHTPTEEDYA